MIRLRGVPGGYGGDDAPAVEIAVDVLRARVDSDEVECRAIVVAYPPHPDDPAKHQIQAELNPSGVVVKIVRSMPDEEPQVVEVIEVLRKHGFSPDASVDWTSVVEGADDEVMSTLQSALYECLDADIPIAKLMEYLLMRTAEVALIAGISEGDFLRAAQAGYRNVLLEQASKASAGEA